MKMMEFLEQRRLLSGTGLGELDEAGDSGLPLIEQPLQTGGESAGDNFVPPGLNKTIVDDREVWTIAGKFVIHFDTGLERQAGKGPFGELVIAWAPSNEAFKAALDQFTEQVKAL